jgi:hypothetical protein
MEQRIILNTTTPDHRCPTQETRPRFSWRLARGADTLRSIATYSLKAVALNSGQNAEEALRANRPVLEASRIRQTFLEFPATTQSLAPGRAYAYRVSAHDIAGKLLGVSNVGLFFVESSDLPVRLADLLCCQGSLLSEGIMAWQRAYGNPQFNATAKSCLEQTGSVFLSGSHDAGDAVYQVVNGSLEGGKRYAVRFCARLIDKGLDYVKFTVLAFNGTLPTSGSHPAPNSSIQIIGQTGRIASTEWRHIMLPPWRAPRNFSGIAVYATTDDSRDHGLGTGELAGICLAEHTGDGCGGFADVAAAAGRVVLPENLQRYADPDSEPQATPVSFGRGRVVDMAGAMFDAGGNLAWYQTDDPCLSFGGELPSGAVEEAEQPVDLGDGYTLDDVEKATEHILNALGKEWDLTNFQPIPPEEPQRCATLRPDQDKPFAGRDIIFIHGLQPGHVMKQIARRYEIETSGSSSISAGIEDRYPESDLAQGFYGAAARNYWSSHITRFLGSVDQPSNRYLIVSFNSNQRLVENVHAVLSQIRNAMNDGTGVVFRDDDRRKSACFGRDCAIVTHSTGALVADVALSLAAQTGSSNWVQAFLGAVAYIPQRVAAHVSLHGAIAGSELAALALVGANVLGVVAPHLDGVVDMGIADINQAQTLGPRWLRSGLAGFNREVNTVLDLADAMTDNLVVYARHAVTVVNNSILVDLAPLVAKIVWGDTINATPTPTLTVAGGHPLSPTNPQTIAKIPLRGFDDGVVNTCSQSASPSLVHPDTYAYVQPALRLFDMGLPPARSLLYFADQYHGSGLSAYGSTPWLSPSGMLQPVASAPAPLARYANHHTFLQSASDHNDPVDPPGAAHGIHEYDRTLAERNYEETLAITDPVVFTSGLVNPAIADLVRECVRGMDLLIDLRIPIPRFTLVPPSVTITIQRLSISIPIWRRRYHHLKASADCYPWTEPSELATFLPAQEPLGECDYVYRFVLR